MNRRTLLTFAGALFAAQRRLPPREWISSAKAQGASAVWRHGTAKFGDLKYPADFRQFDYVNASAPKGGAASQIALGTFNNFNIVVAGVKGALVLGIDQIYDTLLVQSLDEVSSAYGLLAESVSYPDDFSSVTFRLRPEAKWQDGRPVTPDDVIFSFKAFKKFSPQAGANYRRVIKAEKIGDSEVTFTFDGAGARDLPQVVGQLTVLPKHWWEESDESGAKRDVGDTTLEMPLGSGPYRIKDSSPARYVIYERVKDYWGRNLNVNIGRNNFDELKYEYFRDATVAIEAFKKDLVDWRTENSAKNWATAYDFAAVSDKRVILEDFPINNIGLMQAFAFNLRRSKFKDPRVRLAFNYAFDFEDMNKKIFYGQYKRINSYFWGTDLAATGLPTGRELELLEAVRGKVPQEVYIKPYTNPVGGDGTAVRNNLREAVQLLREAGYEVRHQHLVDIETGERFGVELLTNAPLFERVFLFYKRSLERLGMAVSVRTVDAAHYTSRLRKWDFDIITFAWGQTLLPGNELRGYWGSMAANQPGSDNIIGINNLAIDEMITNIVAAKTRNDLIAAARALDRILLWNHYVVPQWGNGTLRTARWNRFRRPDPLPKFGISGFPALWWWDAETASMVGGKRF